MRKQHPRKKRQAPPKAVLRLPDLDQAKSAVLSSLTSIDAQRGYRHAIDKFIEWYCSEPRLSFNRPVVLGYRMHLESRKLAPGTINLLLGNWLLPDQAMALLEAADPMTMKGKRDLALLAILVACGLRRHEAIELNVSVLQRREDDLAIVDLIGKASNIRTIPVPDWVKDLSDDWLQAADSRRCQRSDWHSVEALIPFGPVRAELPTTQERLGNNTGRRVKRSCGFMLAIKYRCSG